MRTLLVIALLSVGALAEARPSDPTEVAFEEARYPSVPLPQGHHVFRDSLAWEEGFAPYWRGMFSPGVEPPAPPRPDFSEHLILAVSYGMTACYDTGGGVERIVRDGDTATVSLGHVYPFAFQCLAEMPRVLYYLVSKADFPEGVEIAFEPASLPYDLDPRAWYPLAVGNAWHFRTGRDRADAVEWVEAEVPHAGETWFRLRVALCDTDPCPLPETRYLRWTEDHYLLTTEAPPGTAAPDTLHPTRPRSLFAVADPYDPTLTSAGEPAHARVALWNDERFMGHLVLTGAVAFPEGRYEVSYLYGLGPSHTLERELLAAIIGGEDFEDTALIRLAVSTPSEASAPVPSAIRVYPHPATEASVLAFTPSESGSARLVVYDLLGRPVLDHREAVVAGSEWRVPLRAEGLAPGLYVVRVTEPGGGTATRSVVVAR
jgi:hypothetical protein